MNKKILITGAKGFLGSNVSKYFKNLGYETYGGLSIEEAQTVGLDYWKKDDISIKSILEFNQKFDLIVHCGGSGSVGFSIENPYEDFKKTVDGTLEVLEYIRLYNPSAHMIYPSSPAVQGECVNAPIKEQYIGKPASPYGYHKKIAEDLCRSYSDKYGIKVSIIRLFSVYGNGLKKQLLWDACNKIMKATDDVVFWGTGEETRDFIHINDVVQIIEKLISIQDKYLVVNGGSGEKHTIHDIVYKIKKLLNSDCNIQFNNQVNKGNPIYYWADVEKLNEIASPHNISLNNGLEKYVEWAKEIL